MKAAEEDAKGVAPNIGAAYEITVFDKDHKVKQVIREDAKCFVMNFLRMIRHWLSNGSHLNSIVLTDFKNLSGTIVSSSGVRTAETIGSFRANAGVGVLTGGIIVGTDATAVTYDDYKIGSIVNHGTGTGNLAYDSGVVGPVTEVGSVMTLSVSRIVSNSTANPITFSEIALYGLGAITVMLLRDVISPSVTLGPGESALIAYKMIING
jgi:hypothetical protein